MGSLIRDLTNFPLQTKKKPYSRVSAQEYGFFQYKPLNLSSINLTVILHPNSINVFFNSFNIFLIMLRAFIKKVLVYAPEKVDGKIIQKIKVIYNFIESIEQ